jgi:hypothetical protein
MRLEGLTRAELAMDAARWQAFAMSAEREITWPEITGGQVQ